MVQHLDDWYSTWPSLALSVPGLPLTDVMRAREGQCIGQMRASLVALPQLPTQPVLHGTGNSTPVNLENTRRAQQRSSLSIVWYSGQPLTKQRQPPRFTLS